MTKKILENVNVMETWTSYIASVGGVLRGAGLWDGEIYELMGMTGLAFHFIIHETCCPSSVTVYDWMNEHFSAMDRIGIYSESYQLFNDPKWNTFEKAQVTAINRIKESLDEGIGVTVWAPNYLLEFGIIKGYDDEDKVFYIQDATGKEEDPLLYINLGKSEVPVLFYQIFKDKIYVETGRIYRDSLYFAINEWNKEYHVNPSYSSGRKGYNSLIQTLERGDFDEFGLAYNMAVYSDSKKCIAKYLEFITNESRELTGLTKAAELYSLVADKYSRITQLVPFSGSNGKGGNVDKNNISELTELVKACKGFEDQAMDIIKKSLES
jgi:hypothetical protein